MTATAPAPAPTEDAIPLRPNGSPVRALIQEFGSLNDGFGELRVHSLMTADPLKHVLLPDYFKGRHGLSVGDWIICTASGDKPVIEPAILIVVAADYGKETAREYAGAKGVRVVLLSALQVQVPGKSKNGASS